MKDVFKITLTISLLSLIAQAEPAHLKIGSYDEYNPMMHWHVSFPETVLVRPYLQRVDVPDQTKKSYVNLHSRYQLKAEKTNSNCLLVSTESVSTKAPNYQAKINFSNPSTHTKNLTVRGEWSPIRVHFAEKLMSITLTKQNFETQTTSEVVITCSYRSPDKDKGQIIQALHELEAIGLSLTQKSNGQKTDYNRLQELITLNDSKVRTVFNRRSHSRHENANDNQRLVTEGKIEAAATDHSVQGLK